LEDLLASTEYDLHFEPVPEHIEHAAMPPLGAIYRRLTREAHVPPPQASYAEAVADAAANMGLDRSAAYARAARAYPSFISEDHLRFCLCAYSTLHEIVAISELDVHYGADLLVLHDQRVLAVQSTLATDNSITWHTTRGLQRLKAVEYVLLELDAQTALHVGAYWLHPLQHVEIVIDAMRSVIMGPWMSKRLPVLLAPPTEQYDFADLPTLSTAVV